MLLGFLQQLLLSTHIFGAGDDPIVHPCNDIFCSVLEGAKGGAAA